MSAAPPPLDEREVERILRILAPLTKDRAVVLVGGQALFLWAQRLGLVVPGSDTGLLSSKDIDFEGSGQAARRAADLLGGSIRVPDIDSHTPNTGVVVFVDSGGVTRKIDFLGTPLGLRAQDVRDTAVRVTRADGVSVWVMHPERCMESRIYNVQILRHDGDHAMGQLRASIVIAREWSRFLLADESRPERERVRAVLRLNERIFRKCLSDLHFRGLFERGINPFVAVLVDDDRLPQAFRERRYPQMVNRLREHRTA
jgi:hypothetical protein